MTNVKKQRMQGRKKMHLELGEITEIIKFKHTSETKEDWPVRWASAGCLRRGRQQRLWAWRHQELVPRSFGQSALGLDPGPSRTSTQALKRRGASCLLVLSLGGVATIWSARRRSAESRQSKLGGWRETGCSVPLKPCRTGPLLCNCSVTGPFCLGPGESPAELELRTHRLTLHPCPFHCLSIICSPPRYLFPFPSSVKGQIFSSNEALRQEASSS